MSEVVPQRYAVKIVFRGLFVASLEASHIDVLLPDAALPAAAIAMATEPLRTLLRSLQPFREHYAALEFHLADWDNRSTLTPRLFQLSKPTKPPVGLYLLQQQEIKFGGLYDAAGEPPTVMLENRELYAQLGHGPLLLRQHLTHGLDQLPGFGSALAPGAFGACAATTRIEFGEVYTERRSRRGAEDRQWRGVSVVSFPTPQERTDVGLPPPPPDLAPRLLNLDLVVRFTLASTNPLQIVCTPTNPLLTPRYFLLKPAEPGGEVVVWIKNRELDSILHDSDLEPDPYLPPRDHGDATDRDHAMYMRLASDPAAMTVPRDHSNEASDSGSGCGGSVRPPGA
jgi:hypothetical protein